jgi:hypothetical protein
VCVCVSDCLFVVDESLMEFTEKKKKKMQL